MTSFKSGLLLFIFFTNSGLFHATSPPIYKFENFTDSTTENSILEDLVREVKSLESLIDLIHEKIRNINSEVNFGNLGNFLVHLGSRFPDCYVDIIRTLYNVPNLNNTWALQMLDAQTKLPSGILQGQANWIGAVGQCRDVVAPKEHFGDHDMTLPSFSGQYCTLKVKVVDKSLGGVPITFGFCVPSSCKHDDLSKLGEHISSIAEHVIPQNILNLTKKLQVDQIGCISDGPSPMDTSSKVVLSIYIIIGLIIFASSLVDWVYKRNNQSHFAEKEIVSSPSNYQSINAHMHTISQSHIESANLIHVESSQPTLALVGYSKPTSPRWVKFAKCFSLLENVPKILDITTTSESLSCIHGVRFFSMLWVVFGHTIYYAINYIGDPEQALKVLRTFIAQALVQTPLSVDSFFLISGILVTYLYLKKEETKHTNWLFFYIHRYIRLTPTYMLILAFWATLYYNVISGPLAVVNPKPTACANNWWWNLLYINNFQVSDQCVGWSWYLAVDMQFYLISPLFLYPLSRWPIIGFSIMGLLLVLSWIVTATLADVYSVTPMLAGVDKLTIFGIGSFRAKEDNNWLYYYDKPYCRIAPFLVGAVFGYLVYYFLHAQKDGSKTFFRMKEGSSMQKWFIALGWILSFSLMTTAVFADYRAPVDMPDNIPILLFQRAGWALGLGWLIFACLIGYGGWINGFLSLPFWIPVSRLTYCAYLIHPIIINAFYQSLEQTITFSLALFIFLTLGIAVVAYFLAFIASLCFESPVMALEKFFLSKKH